MTNKLAENILHFGGVRFRIDGSGQLDMQWSTINDQNQFSLLPLALEETPSREPTRLCNYMTQRAKLKLSTDVIDEYINVNKIIIYIKPTYTSYPG